MPHTPGVAFAVAQQVDHVLLFPFMIYEMLALPDLESYDLSSLRRIMSGGDPLLPWAIERIRDLYPQIDITQVFGLTEGGAISRRFVEPLRFAFNVIHSSLAPALNEGK